MANKIIENLPTRPLLRTTGQPVLDQTTGKPSGISTLSVLLELSGDPAFTSDLAYPLAVKTVAEFGVLVREQSKNERFSFDPATFQRLLRVIQDPKREIAAATLGSYWPYVAGILNAKDEAPSEPVPAAQAAE